jgi:hypothetical protein
LVIAENVGGAAAQEVRPADNVEIDLLNEEDEEEQGYDPNEAPVPVPQNNNARMWIPTHIGGRLDDLRSFSSEFHYNKEATATNPLRRKLEYEVDPLSIYKIYKK